MPRRYCLPLPVLTFSNRRLTRYFGEEPSYRAAPKEGQTRDKPEQEEKASPDTRTRRVEREQKEKWSREYEKMSGPTLTTTLIALEESIQNLRSALSAPPPAIRLDDNSRKKKGLQERLDNAVTQFQLALEASQEKRSRADTANLRSDIATLLITTRYADKEWDSTYAYWRDIDKRPARTREEKKEVLKAEDAAKAKTKALTGELSKLVSKLAAQEGLLGKSKPELLRLQEELHRLEQLYKNGRSSELTPSDWKPVERFMKEAGWEPSPLHVLRATEIQRFAIDHALEKVKP